MRLFVAVDVPASLRDAIEADVVAPLRAALPSARWTRPEGRHLTLKFLGEVDEDRVAAVEDALLAVDVRGFEASFDRLGGFPNLRRPRVLWIGVGPGADPMAAVAADVERVLEPLGFAQERRAFHPHLTLARFRPPEPIGGLPDVLVPGEPFEVTGFVLFRSQLHPKGARYDVRMRFGA